MSRATIYGLSTALVFCVLVIIGLIVGIVIESNKTSSTSTPRLQINPYEYQLNQDVQAATKLGQQLQNEIAKNGLENIKSHIHHITAKVRFVISALFW